MRNSNFSDRELWLSVVYVIYDGSRTVTTELNSCYRDPMARKDKNYLLSGLLQKMFADPRSRIQLSRAVPLRSGKPNPGLKNGVLNFGRGINSNMKNLLLCDVSRTPAFKLK